MKYLYLFLFAHFMLFPAAAQEKKKTHQKMDKGNAHLNISIPHTNHITHFAVQTNKEDIGILGLTLGGDCCYTDKKFVSVQFGVANARFVEEVVGSGDDGWYHDNDASSWFLNVRDNYSIRKFDFGYGLSLSQLRYTAYDYNNRTGEDTSKFHQNLALGTCFSVYLNTGRSFNIGVLYQPQFISFSGTPVFNYEHTLCIDVLFRIGIWRNKKNEDTDKNQ